MLSYRFSEYFLPALTDFRCSSRRRVTSTMYPSIACSYTSRCRSRLALSVLSRYSFLTSVLNDIFLFLPDLLPVIPEAGGAPSPARRRVLIQPEIHVQECQPGGRPLSFPVKPADFLAA